MKNQHFDIAFSYESNHQWIARDLFTLLHDMGMSVYFSENIPNFTAGFLRRELVKLYSSSIINVMLWSKQYQEQSKDSIITLEKTTLWDRHIGKNQHDSLFILLLDDIPIPDDFSQCLHHKIQEIGLLKTRDYIISQLVECWTSRDEKGERYQHPTSAPSQRGPTTPCKFYISNNYKKDTLRRWDILADIEVQVVDRKAKDFLKVYLIPSAKVPNFLGHSLILKSNSRCLAIKRSVSEAFAINYSEKQLTGVIFEIEKEGMRYPHVYCMDYDQYLIENWQEHYGSFS